MGAKLVSMIKRRQKNKENVIPVLEDYDPRYEGTLDLRIKKVSQLKNQFVSPVFYAYGWPLKLLVRPRKRSDGSMYLGLFLQANSPKYENEDWLLESTFAITIHCSTNGARSKVMRFQHVFNRIRNDFGCKDFISFNELLNPENGYVIGDTVNISVQAYVGIPENFKPEHFIDLRRRRK